MRRPYWLGMRSALDNFWVQAACVVLLGLLSGFALVVLLRLLTLVGRIADGLCS